MKAFLQLILIGFLSLLLGGAVQEITEITLGKSRKLPNISLFYGIIIFAIIIIVRLILHYRKLGKED